MNGKSKCKILKEIRQQIALDNDIEFVTANCTYKGECRGTCPRCEEELRYLEMQLEKRRRAGKTIIITSAAAAALLLAGAVFKEAVTDIINDLISQPCPGMLNANDLQIELVDQDVDTSNTDVKI